MLFIHNTSPFFSLYSIDHICQSSVGIVPERQHVDQGEGDVARINGIALQDSTDKASCTAALWKRGMDVVCTRIADGYPVPSDLDFLTQSLP